jgi:hypothetical protein
LKVLKLSLENSIPDKTLPFFFSKIKHIPENLEKLELNLTHLQSEQNSLSNLSKEEMG